jgi:hypothetical protein
MKPKKLAKLLTKLSGGRIFVKHRRDGYSAMIFDLESPDEEIEIIRDFDGIAAPAGDQLVSELRRISSVYTRLADNMENAIQTSTPMAKRELPLFSVVLVEKPDDWKPARLLAVPAMIVAKKVQKVAVGEDDANAFCQDFNLQENERPVGLWAVYLPAIEAASLAISS